ncbi:hypothetical protein BDN67DRAFT_871363, partial [Paxillus ammoniavirescens]
VAGVRRSGRQCQLANKNKEYQRMLDEEVERQANLWECEPEIPGAFAASLENMEDFIFAGSTNSNSDESLPRTLKEAYSGPEEELWK